MNPRKTPLHKAFQAPLEVPPEALAARVRELEHTIQLMGVALIAVVPKESRPHLRQSLSDLADAAWSQSLPKAAHTLRAVAAAVPKDDLPPF